MLLFYLFLSQLRRKEVFVGGPVYFSGVRESRNTLPNFSEVFKYFFLEWGGGADGGIPCNL